MTQSMTNELHIEHRHVGAIDALPADIPLRLRQIYAARGIQTPLELDHGTQGLLPPSGFKGLSTALALLTEAIQQQKRMLIVGDFDCDGATSTTLMVLALRQMGARQVNYLVPNRFEYGYGLSPEIAALAAEQQTELLITVDNGISSIAGVAYAKAHGMQVIVTDHHLPGAELPAADAIINPNQPGCTFGSGHLAGVGVAFYLMAALKSHLQQMQWFSTQHIAAPNIADYLDLVALGTVADVVALDRNNRILVHQGLQRIRSGRCRAGIQALCEVAGKDLAKLTASDLGFALGPRLNAVGRLDDMTLGISCLLSLDISQARSLASEMDRLNQERKVIENGMQQEAIQALSHIDQPDGVLPSALVFYQADWHQGVVGLVASRMKEKYHRPVFAFAQTSPDELKGSGRSIAGLHMRDALERLDQQHPGLILRYGGHAMAAGLSLPVAHLDTFRQRFTDLVADWVAPEQLAGVILTDGELAKDELSMRFTEQIQQGGPWGQAFPEPCFDGVFTLRHQRLVGAKHLKMEVESPDGQLLDAIAFNVDLDIWPNAGIRQIQLVYRLDINEWRGQRTLQLLVDHIRPL
jgi:single-stranded-DNA-specific exonuclease